MPYKYLSDINLKLHAIGMGTWKYHGGVETIRKALRLGPCLIDTAEGYGTEEIIGKAVKGFRDKTILATKVWPTHFKYKDVIKAAENSLRRLQTDYIDIYQLHWPNPTVPVSETMQAMESLVDAGKIRFIGVCNFSTGQLKKAEVVMTRHEILFNQVSYSLIDRDIERYLLPYCTANGIMVIAYSPLSNNLRVIQAMDRLNALNTISGATGKTHAQIVLNWCIRKTNVVAIPKTNSLCRVVENFGAAGWRLSPQHVELLEYSIKSPRGPIERKLRKGARWFLEITGFRKPIYKLEINYK